MKFALRFFLLVPALGRALVGGGLGGGGGGGPLEIASARILDEAGEPLETSSHVVEVGSEREAQQLRVPRAASARRAACAATVRAHIKKFAWHNLGREGEREREREEQKRGV